MEFDVTCRRIQFRDNYKSLRPQKEETNDDIDKDDCNKETKKRNSDDLHGGGSILVANEILNNFSKIICNREINQWNLTIDEEMKCLR